MRSRLLFCSSLFALAATFFPLAARGQFQEPTKEELSMTSDPKAPGAAAVFLYFEEKTDDPMHYHSVYARIKVLSDKGKDLATVEVPYAHGEQKVTDIHARTIHPDGTVVPLEGKPEDLMAMKSGDVTVNKRVFNLPSVTVGSILEYRYQIRYDDDHFSSPYWVIQRPYFIHKAHYMFMPFKAFQKGPNSGTSMYLTDSRGNKINTLIWWPQLPPGANLVDDATGRFTLDLTDIPAIPDEEYMPPEDAFLYQLLFYYRAANNGVDYWTTEGKRWSKETDHFAEPSGAIKAAVAGIIAPGDSEIDKAKKLYKAAQALDNTDYSRAKSKAELKAIGQRVAKRAEDTWAQKSGSRQDIALLYLAMLRAAGLTAYDMKMVRRTRNIFQANYLEFEQLDDDVVILATGGKEIFLDPGEKMCPFGLVGWIHSGAGGVRQTANGTTTAITPLQVYPDNAETRVGDVTIAENGSVEGSLRFVMTGQRALYWRQRWLLSDEQEARKEFDRSIEGLAPEGVELKLDHFLGMDDPSVNLVAIVKASGTLGSQVGHRLLLPGFFFETRSGQPFVKQAERLEPIDMEYGSRLMEQVTYHLPANMTVEGAPKDTNELWSPNENLVTKTVQKPGEITVARLLVRSFTFLAASDYKDLRGFYQKVAANDQQQVVLTAAKGN